MNRDEQLHRTTPVAWYDVVSTCGENHTLRPNQVKVTGYIEDHYNQRNRNNYRPLLVRTPPSLLSEEKSHVKLNDPAHRPRASDDRAG